MKHGHKYAGSASVLPRRNDLPNYDTSTELNPSITCPRRSAARPAALLAAAIFAAASLPIVLSSTAAQSQVRMNGPVASITLPKQLNLGGGIDFANAQPMPLPSVRTLPPSPQRIDPLMLFGQPGVEPGSPGNGQQNPVTLLAPQLLPQKSQVIPQEFGTSGQPYTTSEVDAYGDATATFYPFSAAGQLFFNVGSGTAYCSASLIKPGVVVTAAHCVANYGQQQFYSNWMYVPALDNGNAPYGVWTAQTAYILTSYFNGTDNCAVFGVVCPDDVAVITQNVDGSGNYPGVYTGWFAYGWNGYGYNGSGQALINQLGYPVALDGGLIMERNDSQGSVSAPNSNNTIIGSLMTGGSSGGPWTVNLGAPPSLSGIGFGTYADHNVVVHVTSWGFTDTTIKQQGASPFTDGNVVVLVNGACSDTPAAC